MQATTRTFWVCLCLLWLCGCATLPAGTTRSPRDPWERMNRTTYKLNTALDHAILRPVARGYHRVVPPFAQNGVSNFLSNLSYPKVMINDVLQGQFRAFANDTARLLMNTTFGVGGLFDPATRAGLDRNDRDFGQTFGKWGIKSGPYVVLPLFGPSDVRDAIGKLPEYFADPRYFIRNPWWEWSLWGLGVINARVGLLPLDPSVDSAYDPYALVRNVYLQGRDFKVYGETSDQQDEQEQKLFDQAAQDIDTPAPKSAPAPEAPPPPAATPPPH
jgi:phospholipid-binding lipoprotein MlaA